MIELVKNTKIDFMGLKRYAFPFSAVLLLLGIVGTVQIYRGQANLGIDLAGGTSIQLKFQKPFSMDEIRSILAKSGHSESTLQEVSGVNILRRSLPGNPFVVESVSEIGPAIGHKLRQDAALALLVSALAIIIYLAWRFEFKFGVAAALATFHDIFILVGIFWALGIEMDLLFITALLTFVAVVSLIVFGGIVLRDFALALAMGIVIGTYSSIFVASPVVALWRGEKMTEVKR